MAIAHSTSKTRSDRNPPRKSTRTPKSTNRSSTPAKRRKTPPAQSLGPHAKGLAMPDRPGSPIAERGSRIRLRGRLREMIGAELLNLEKAESVLNCLRLSMGSMSLDKGSPYFPDVVEVAGDLVKRSIVDLVDLYDGRVPDPLMATLKVER